MAEVKTTPTPIIHGDFYEITDEEGHAHSTRYISAVDLPIISNEIRQCMIDLAKHFEPTITEYRDWDESDDDVKTKQWCDVHPRGNRTMKDVLDFWTLQGNLSWSTWHTAMGTDDTKASVYGLHCFTGLGRAKFVPAGDSLLKLECNQVWDLHKFCKDRDYLARFLNDKNMCIKLYERD